MIEITDKQIAEIYEAQYKEFGQLCDRGDMEMFARACIKKDRELNIKTMVVQIQVDCKPLDELVAAYLAEIGQTVESMRDLREWHFDHALKKRRFANSSRGNGLDAKARDLDEQANKHLGFVQLLNNFFPVGDNDHVG